MESGPLKGKHIAFPNITYDRPTKKLNWPATGALKSAVEKGEYIEFKTEAEAAHFSKKYKRGTSMR